MSESQETKSNHQATSASNNVEVKTEPHSSLVKTEPYSSPEGGQSPGVNVSRPFLVKTENGGYVAIKTEPNFTTEDDISPMAETHTLPLKWIKTENGGHVVIKTEPQSTFPGSEAMDETPQQQTVPGADSGAESMDAASDKPGVLGADAMEETSGHGAEPTEPTEKSLEDVLKYETVTAVEGWYKGLESPRGPKVRKIQTSTSDFKTSQTNLVVPHTGVAPAGTPYSDGMMGFSTSKNVDQGTLPSNVGRETDPAEEQETAPSEGPIASGAEVQPEEASFPTAEAQSVPHVPEVPGEGLMGDVSELPTVSAVEVYVEPTASAVDEGQDEPTSSTTFDSLEEFGEQTVPAMEVQEDAPEAPKVPGDEELEETSVPAVQGWDQASDVPTAPKVRKVQPKATAVQSTQAAQVAQEVPSTADSQPMPRYMTRLQARIMNIKIIPQYL